MSIAEQGLMFFIAENNFFDDISVENIVQFEKEILMYAYSYHLDLMQEINKDGNFNDIIKKKFIELINNFKNS